jgi:hypothetical protein
MNRQSSETVAARRQLEKIEAEIRNCTRAIASEGLSSFLQTRLASETAGLEAQHRNLTEKLAASEPCALKRRLRDTHRFVETRLQNLQSMFEGEPGQGRDRAAQKITLTPAGKSYIASGVWDWLGGVAVGRGRIASNSQSPVASVATQELTSGVAVTMVPGARIELATPAFSGRRSTSELPRHAGVC